MKALPNEMFITFNFFIAKFEWRLENSFKKGKINNYSTVLSLNILLKFFLMYFLRGQGCKTKINH